MVPTVVEFDNGGTEWHVTEHAKRLAAGMPTVYTSIPGSQTMYASRVIEVVQMSPDPVAVKLDDLTAPGSA